MADFSAPITISTAFTTAIDIFEVKAGASNPVEITGWEIGQTTELGDAQEEFLKLALYRYSGSPTSGSGGGTSTFVGTGAQGLSSNATIETGNTTSITGGTAELLWRWAWQVRQSHLYIPLPNVVFRCGVGQYLVLKLEVAPADSIGGTQGLIGGVSIFET